MWFYKGSKIKDGSSRFENTTSQPLKQYPVFNNADVLTEAWYPVGPSKKLKTGKTLSWKLGRQRLVLFRGKDGRVQAIDAFCPHMGADLANGKVVENDIQCYFHQWRFNGRGHLTHVPCKSGVLPQVKINSYPVEEKFGWVWVFSGLEAPYSIPAPPGLEQRELSATHLGSATLFAHHHVMMATGIDIQHFATVHNLDIKFQLTTRDLHSQIFDWILQGELPETGWRAKLARKLVGRNIAYTARFAGGSIVTLAYNPEGTKVQIGPLRFNLPPLHIFWGSLPLESGVSRVHVFSVTEKKSGFSGWIKTKALFALTVALLIFLRDDDVKAFPGMRFNPGHLLPIDSSVARFIQKINTLPLSIWSKKTPDESAASSQPLPIRGSMHGHPPANA